MTGPAERFHELVSGRAHGVRASAIRAALWAASRAFGWAVRARNLAYDRGWLAIRRAGVPVVSVGNLTLGGTGKTPCVEALARYYRQRGARVVILSRGYGGGGGANDEAQVLEENLDDVPHLQGPDRAALATTAVEELEAELLILDDGFQHRRLARDLDVVLVDAANPWGHGHVFPRGLLREPPSSLRRASAVVLTRCDQAGDGAGRSRKEVLGLVNAYTPVVESDHRPVEWRCQERRTPPEGFAGRVAIAFCGIGNPEAYRRTLENLQIRPREFRSFSDHHNYTRADVDDLRAWAARQPAGTVVLTTQKDAVKLRLGELAGRELWALRVGLEFRPTPDLADFFEQLDRLIPRQEVEGR